MAAVRGFCRDQSSVFGIGVPHRALSQIASSLSPALRSFRRATQLCLRPQDERQGAVVLRPRLCEFCRVLSLRRMLALV